RAASVTRLIVSRQNDWELSLSSGPLYTRARPPRQSSSDFSRDGLRDVGGLCRAAEVRCQRPAADDNALERADDLVVQLGMTEVFQHQGAGPDRANRIRDAFAGDVGRRAVNRLEHRRTLLRRIDVSAGRDA